MSKTIEEITADIVVAVIKKMYSQIKYGKIIL